MAGGGQRPCESLWFEYNGKAWMVFEEVENDYKLSLKGLHLDYTAILLNDVANLLDESGWTTRDKLGLQERLGTVGNTKDDPIKIDCMPVPGAVAGGVGAGTGTEAGLTLQAFMRAPLPQMGFVGSTTASTAYSESVLPLEVLEWDVLEEVASWSAKLPNHQLGRYYFERIFMTEISSEPGVCNTFDTNVGQRVNALLRAFRQHGLSSRDMQLLHEPNLASSSPQTDSSAGGTSAAQKVSAPDTALDMRSRPDFQLRSRITTGEYRGGRLHSFVEIKQPSVLGNAGTDSLAAPYAAEVKRRAGERGASPAVRSTIIQCFKYCLQYRTKYFAISTYFVTWICKVEVSEVETIDGKCTAYKMYVSKGIQWCALQQGQNVTAVEALMWLFMAAESLDLTPVQPPLRPQHSPGKAGACSPSDGLSSSSVGDSDGPVGDKEPGNGNHSTCDSGSGDGSHEPRDAPRTSGTYQTLEGLVMDATEELGHGCCGTVYGGWLHGRPVAGKTCPEEDCMREAWMFERLHIHQGRYTPELLYAGPTPRRTAHCLIMSRVYGRQLREGEAEMLPAALEALRAVHAAGVVHGDIRAPNFLVTSCDNSGPHVVVIDFGRSYLSNDPTEYLDEEQQLHELLGTSMQGQPPATSRPFTAVACDMDMSEAQSFKQGRIGSLHCTSSGAPCSSAHMARAGVEPQQGAHEVWEDINTAPAPQVQARQPCPPPVASSRSQMSRGQVAQRQPARLPNTTVVGTAVRVRRAAALTAGRGVLRCM